jgi:sugar lactone lactonase YvrE
MGPDHAGTDLAADTVAGPRSVFGESPFFDPRDGSIVHVDTLGRIIQHRPDDSWTSWAVPEGLSFAIPSAPGGFLVGLARRGICRFDPGANSFEPLHTAMPQGHQSNDATVDPVGRLIFGTRSREADAFDGTLVVHDAWGSRVVADGFGLVNGLAVDPTAGRLWVADTHPDIQKVWAYEYDLATGSLGARFLLNDFHDRRGRPDGAALDAAGNLWLAEIGGSALVCLSPDGDVLREIALPVSMPTKPCFDGRGRLLVTTASRGIDLVREPAAGHLLSLDVPGASRTAIAAV